MAGKTQNILILGSNVLISSLPVKEVSLLREGSLPAYGYNPGDSLELLAGQATIEEGRQEQCLTWLKSMLDPTDPALAFYPGALIFATVIAFNFLGDGLQDALDPRAGLRA